MDNVCLKEKLKDELTEATEFLKELSPKLDQARELINKWKLHNTFNKEHSLYGTRPFNPESLINDINSSCWASLINSVDFLSFDQKNKMIEGLIESSRDFVKESDNFVDELTTNKNELIEESLKCFFKSLTKYRLFQGKVRKEKSDRKINKNIKFYHFMSFEDGYKHGYHDDSTMWFNDLERVLDFILGHENCGQFGDTLRNELLKAVDLERFNCQVKGKYFDVKVFKSGNVELFFKNGNHEKLNSCYAALKNFSLKQFLLIETLKDYAFKDTYHYASGFEYQRITETNGAVIKFDFMPKNGKPCHGFLEVYQRLVKIRIEYGTQTYQENVLERNTAGNIYKGIMEAIRKFGKELDDRLRVEKEQKEFVDFEKEERKRRLMLVEKGALPEESHDIVEVPEASGPQIQSEKDQVIDQLIEEAYQEIEKMTSNFNKIKEYAIRLSEKGNHINGKQLLDKANQVKDQITWNHQYIDKLKASKSNKFVSKTKSIATPVATDADQKHQENVIYLNTSEYQINDESSEIQIEVTEDGSIFVTGDTKPFKEDLKKFKLMWSRKLGKWYVPGSRKREYCEQTKKHLNDLKCLLESKGVLVTSYVANM